MHYARISVDCCSPQAQGALPAAITVVSSRDANISLNRGEQWGNRFLEALECLRVTRVS